MQLFEILAACYETLMDKEARWRCDVLLQDQEKALLHRTLSWKHNRTSTRINKKVVGLLMSNGKATAGDGADNYHTLGFVGLNTMPSLAEISSCGSMDESFLTQEDHSNDWKHGCVAESHRIIDGQEQVEIVYSLDDDALEDDAVPLGKYMDDTDCEKDRCAFPATTVDQSTNLRPLRILHSQQSSWDEEDEHDDSLLPDPMEPNSFPSEMIPQGSLSTENSSEHHETSNADMHYTGAEIDRMFGGPLQLLFRARRWQVFRDPFDVFAEVFGGPLYGDVPCTTLTTTAPKGPSIRTALQLPPPMEKLPSEHISRRTTIHRTRRIALGKEIVRTAVVRIDPRTKQRHVTISVTTEDVSISDHHHDEDPQWNSLFQFLDSVCVNWNSSDGGNNGTCFCFKFSIYT